MYILLHLFIYVIANPIINIFYECFYTFLILNKKFSIFGFQIDKQFIFMFDFCDLFYCFIFQAVINRKQTTLIVFKNNESTEV